MTGHTDWCARDHQCGLFEHRSDPIVIDLPGYGRALLVRVRADGREHAELRMRIALDPAEIPARRQLAGLLAGLRDVITDAVAAGRTQDRWTA